MSSEDAVMQADTSEKTAWTMPELKKGEVGSETNGLFSLPHITTLS